MVAIKIKTGSNTIKSVLPVNITLFFIKTNQSTRISEQIKTENDIENLITAQTNSKCLVTYNEDSIEVILPKETLNEKSVVKIKDIIISKTKLSTDNITIIETQ